MTQDHRVLVALVPYQWICHSKRYCQVNSSLGTLEMDLYELVVSSYRMYPKMDLQIAIQLTFFQPLLCHFYCIGNLTKLSL
jgi:hypothetical protein